MIRRRAALLASLLVVSACAGDSGVRSTQYVPLPEYPWDNDTPAVLAPDPDTRIVTLDNGLVVYLRNNAQPGDSVELRLAVNAGSGVEDPDQSGVAHFLEHMLFNGTEEFPGNELIATLRSFGMEFGADVNAYTSYDETVYELNVPLDEPDALGVGLDVLAQWLSAATIDPDEVEAERGVILDEYRIRDQTLSGRQFVTIADMLLGGGPYEGRQPIGTAEAIESMTAEPLRRFYDDWYRPDNAAVIVVGDIDVDDAEEMIRERFDDIEPRSTRSDRPDLSLSPYAEVDVRVDNDLDATAAVFELNWPAPSSGNADDVEGAERDGMRRSLALQVAFDIVATRLSDDVRRGDAPFFAAGDGNLGFVRGLTAPGVYVVGSPEDATDAAEALTDEFERLRRFGIHPNELERAIAPLRAAADADLVGRETRSDREFADELVAHFLTGAPIATPRDEHREVTRILNVLSVDEVEAVLAEHLATAAPHLYVSLPDDSDAPTAASLLALLESAAERTLEARPPAPEAPEALMEAPEAVEEDSSELLVRDVRSSFDADILEFPNGAQVVINPTNLVDGEVTLVAWSPGGVSQMDEDDVVVARYATAVAEMSGIGDLDAVEAAMVRESAQMELFPVITLEEEWVTGTASTDDLELALQQLHLWFDDPQFDEAALEALKASDRALIESPGADPELASYLELLDARYGDNPWYAVLPTLEQLDDIDIDDVERVFTDRFDNPRDWVFVISGDIDEEVAADLARMYLGSLRGSGRAEFYDPIDAPTPDGVVSREVRAGVGNTAMLTLQFETPSEFDDLEETRVRLLDKVLDIRLTDVIREELSATYSPRTMIGFGSYGESVMVSVMVSGDPDEMDAMEDAILRELADLAENGPTEEEFDAAVAAVEREYGAGDNETVAWGLVGIAFQPGYQRFYLGRSAALYDVSADDLAEFATRAMPLDHYIRILQLPR